jgi:hypothetical protein
MAGKAALFYNISLCVELILVGIFFLKSTLRMTGQTKINLTWVWRPAQKFWVCPFKRKVVIGLQHCVMTGKAVQFPIAEWPAGRTMSFHLIS